MALKRKVVKHSPNAFVAILMGSESDLAVMRETGGVLDGLKVQFELRVLSAHRTPDALHEYMTSAERRGCVLYVAAAGLAAHLAGAVAAHTLKPVIGVPLEAGPLRGFDALLSTVQMPAGVPVACTAIGKHGARNAGFLAAQIMAVNDKTLVSRLRTQRRRKAEDILRQNDKLEKSATA
ncbi:MAG: 5-(carboxyamino)imidazole ribonucleotide mutase [Candidatus Porifericomitaceae bacterium WSBS_2022_MAG_OTU9]